MFDGLRVLLVEDDAAVRVASAQTLRLAGIAVDAFDSAAGARARLRPGFPGVLVSDVRLPQSSGIALMQTALALDPALPVILITGHGDITMAVGAMRQGAYDFLEKPVAAEALVGAVGRALEKRVLTFELQALRRNAGRDQDIEALLIGRSAPMAALRRTILSLSDAGPDVLIQGETGTGKELVALCLHRFSPRAAGPFVAINCGGLPDSTFESEIFGHEAGSFTGALKRRIGKVEYASGGTLLLDEIELMPLPMQVKVLRVLQERRIERLGSNVSVNVDVRVVAATKIALDAASERGVFRHDLYHRLEVVTLDIPPLRDRREDIPLLFEHFAQAAAERYGRAAPLLSDRLSRALIAHAWPGNVRELRNVADRHVLGVLAGPLGGDDPDARARPLSETVAAFERGLILDALRRSQGEVTAASEALGVPKKTLYDKIARYGLGRNDE